MQQPHADRAGLFRPVRRIRVIAAGIAVASLSGAGALTLAVVPAERSPLQTRTADIQLVTTDVPPPPAPPADPPPGAETPTTVGAPPPAPAPAPGSPTPAPSQADAGRVNNDKGGFSFVVPPGWEQADTSRLTYGSALLTNPALANGSILLGRLDLKLFAGAEPDNGKAAVRLASDMGEFFMPYPGNRVNQDNETFDVGDMSAASSYYEVKFDDPTKETGEIWAAAIGKGKDRWFVVWLGTASSPIDKGMAKNLAESIRPWTAPNAPAPTPIVDPNQAPAEAPSTPPPVPPAPAVAVPQPAAQAPAPAPGVPA